MVRSSRLKRFWAGLGVLLFVLAVGFGLINRLIETWGTAPEERALVLPGDELLPEPLVNWNHAVTINAPVEQVWPWIIQIGDTRGGFYSYMFIERLVGGDFSLYNNADRIHPEWQDPAPGQGIIADVMAIREYKPNDYLLAHATEKMGGLGWTWLWKLTPTADGQTRMNIHMRIQLPPEMPSYRAFTFAMNVLTFLMERDMMQGIQLRAEGGYEPAWTETLELALWLAALVIGVVGGWRYLTHPAWQRHLAVALAAVVSLFAMVYLQPPLWVWAAIVLVLLAGLAWAGGQLQWPALPRRRVQETG